MFNIQHFGYLDIKTYQKVLKYEYFVFKNLLKEG